MILRILIPLLLLILLPDVYLWLHRLRRPSYTWAERLLWLLPSLGMVVFTIILACAPSFVPDDIYWVRLYIALLGVWVLPKFVYALCSSIGWGVCHMAHRRHNWGRLVGIALGGYIIYVFIYGYTIGFGDIQVRHIDLAVKDLPARFDGVRIAHFSDAHVGTYTGRRTDILRRAVDSIMAQRPDLICFTGDIQNVQPAEVEPVVPLLSRLHAPLGVFSVLGNHDYASYQTQDENVRQASVNRLCHTERAMGWQLLRNEHCVVRRGGDSIVVAGMENDGEPPFPALGDAARTMQGVPHKTFTLMLQHDPSAWQRTILPKTQAQLTLSGHTHGGQVSIFGLRFTQWGGRKDLGLYCQGGRYLYVSGGLGGVLALRYGVPPEITIIALHRKP